MIRTLVVWGAFFVVIVHSSTLFYPLYSQEIKGDAPVRIMSKLLLKKEGIAIAATDTFPRDLACEVKVGNSEFPIINIEGANGQVEKIRVEVDKKSVISTLRKQGDDSYVLYLFSEDDAGKVFALFDLNCDGQWDVKKTPTRDRANFIWFEGNWLEVDEIHNLLSKKPEARAKKARYEFADKWRRAE